ncbi:Putative virion core protein (lumpy skin disease virus) [hydrothermal vent metagenome]|uniref:Putative virion core protein (Lumpy skin disease virus) n=1 Tax=hydrothermal vent metagenome TaxID=652676 RepID=A0A1W1BWE4_9ZZZZ
MGLFDWIGGQFIDVIEWTDDSHDTMVYRFERHENEIKYGAKLTVRESQIAVFVNEGVIADIMTPGIYELETQNMPIMTSLKHWDHGFSSPFKAEVYFVSTKRFTNLKWGTKNPIMVRDPEFAMVRLRAFGTYEIRIDNPEVFLKEIVGTDGHFTTDEVEGQLTNLILSKFATILGKDATPVLDLAGNYEMFGQFITEGMSPYFKEYGLELTKMLIENISLPEAVEKALDTRSSRAITGNLNEHLQYQSAEAMARSAENGGGMSDMMGMGAGMGMGQAMAGMMGNMGQQNNAHAPSPSSPPPPLPSSKKYFVAVNGQQTGPFDDNMIASQIMGNQIARDTLVWAEGMAGWTKAGEVFASKFSATPPPMPPSL